MYNLSKKMFLVEKGKYVVIRNTQGEEYGFGSFEEFYKYCPIPEFNVDLTGKDYIDYEPDRNLYIDNTDETIDYNSAPIPEYENLINNIDVILSRVRDPYYFLTLEESIEVKKETTKAEATITIQMKWSLQEQLNYALGIKSKTEGKTSTEYNLMISEITAIYTDLETKLVDIEKCKTKEELKSEDLKIIK